jgi:V-type H+-transporting ATPase subunit H
MYKKEVLSGKLQWTPVHKSEKFWKENAAKFEENGNELLMYVFSFLVNFLLILIIVDFLDLNVLCFCVFSTNSRLKKILESSNDATTVSVAAYDVGEFSRAHPRGRT